MWLTLIIIASWIVYLGLGILATGWIVAKCEGIWSDAEKAVVLILWPIVFVLVLLVELGGELLNSIDRVADWIDDKS